MSTLRDRLTNPKFLHSLLALVLTVVGFTAGTEIKEQVSGPTTVEVNLPEQPDIVLPEQQVVIPHHIHDDEDKDWLPVIRAENEKLRKQLLDNFHGGG